MKYRLELSSKAVKDLDFFRKTGSVKLVNKIVVLFSELQIHPRTGTGKPKQLTGDLSGFWSRRIDQKNRMIYKIVENIVIVEVLSLQGHYSDK
jgi:toxin YoeB